MSGQLLTPAQIAERLAVSRSWVYAAAADGRLPAVRLGGKDGPLRFIEADVNIWIAEARALWHPGDSGRTTLGRPSEIPRAIED